MPLNEQQQMQIAVAMRATQARRSWIRRGARRACANSWRFPSISPRCSRFLKARHSQQPGGSAATLRAVHETEASHAEALRAVAQGFQQDYLEGLAVFATRAANTAIADSNARRSIFETENLLADNGQITIKPQPDAVLDVLVSDHVLMRAGDTPGYLFQHQQFQEWYASHSVERRIIAEVADPERREALKAEVFNLPTWEEAILFAVERLARGDAHQRAACGKAIVAAFEVDPILAAEMIFRANGRSVVADQCDHSRTRGALARAGKSGSRLPVHAHFGRSEFFNTVWPLITDENEQISLNALRNCRRFRPSILGRTPRKE